MRKDFTLAVVLSGGFLLLANFSLGPLTLGARSAAHYLIHPSARTLAKAYRHSFAVSESWRDLLKARILLDRIHSEEFDKEFELYLEELEAGEREFQERISRLAQEAAAASGLPSRMAHGVRVVYRGLGQEGWVSRGCTDAQGKDWPSAMAAIQFAAAPGRFVYAGRRVVMQDPDHRVCFELVTSNHHAISVSVERTGEIGLLRGLGRPDRLVLDYLDKESEVQVGDRLRTSRSNSLAPEGILVAEVIKVEPALATQFFSRAYAVPYFDLARLDHLIALEMASAQ